MEFYKPDRFEDWEEINGFPDYEVSNMGEVENTRLEHILEPIKSNSGAFVVNMKHEGGKFKQAQIKRLVMGAFKKPKPVWTVQSVIGHYNRNPEDCSSYNLYWSTRSRMLMWDSEFVRKELKHPAWLNRGIGDEDILVEQFESVHDMAQSLGICPIYALQKVWDMGNYGGFQFRMGRY